MQYCSISYCCSEAKGVFTFNLFGWLKTNSDPFARLVQFIWTGVKAVNRTLGQTKQPNRDRLKRWFQADSDAVCLWCESKRTNYRI